MFLETVALWVLAFPLVASDHELCAYCRSDLDFPDPNSAKPKLVRCTDQFDQERFKYIHESDCGEPRDVLTWIKVASFELASPSALMIKRCVGTCDHTFGDKCSAITSSKRDIPIRKHDIRTNKESCAIAQVEVHETCGCCQGCDSNDPYARRIDPGTNPRLAFWQKPAFDIDEYVRYSKI